MFKQILGKYGGHLKLRQNLLLISLLFFSVIGFMAWRTSQQCSVGVDTVPIQIVYLTRNSDVTTLSRANLDYYTPAFNNFSFFVRDITEHLEAKLAQEKFCLNSTKSKERSLIQFVPWVINSGPRPLYLAQPLEARPVGVCRISSPWIELVVERKPVHSVRGIVRYNERQLLADQAMLAGVHNVPQGVAVPLTYDEFNRYADLEYSPSEIHHQPAEKPIEERVPPDLLWLFRRARPDEGPRGFSGSAGGSMRLAMEAGREGYTKIVIALIDHCFESDGAEIQFNSILDLADLVDLEQYKIVRSIVSIPEHYNY